MKLPKRIQDVLKRKQEFIDSQRDRLENTVIKQQSKLFSDLVSEMIPQLDVKDGMIQDNVKNYRLLSSLDKTYKNFQLLSNQIFLDQIIIGTAKVADLSTDYFKIVLGGDLPERFDKIIAETNKLINLKLGLDGGKLQRGGFLQSFFDSNTIGTDLKQMTSKAVTSNMDMKDYIKMLQDKITGTKEYTGGLERQFQRYAYDIYQQYDAAYNLMLGNEFGFNYFIYQGGLVKDSREFCVEHNNKVYSVEEAQSWGTWVSPTTGETPSYLGYPGYDPLIDRGGYNCRHALGWIPDDVAEGMRRDLNANAPNLNKEEFSEAKSINDAQHFASQYGGSVTKGFDIPLDQLNIANRELSKMPGWAIDTLRKANSKGMEFVNGPGGITQHPSWSYLKGKKVPGWRGKTWNVVPGLGSTDPNLPSVANVESLFKGHGSKNLILHEYGHGVDGAWGKGIANNFLSNSKEWRLVHNELRSENKLGHAYHDIEKKETFAESFAKYYNSEDSKSTLNNSVIKFFENLDQK